MVVGIIAGTVVVFVLVLCALFYCAKLENDKTRRGLKAEEDDGPGEEGGSPPTPQRLPPSTTIDDEGVEMIDGNGDGDGCGRQPHRNLPREHDVKSRPAERRPSSVTVVAGDVDDARGGYSATTKRPAGADGVRKKGIFGWGGKKSSGRG